MTNKEKKQAKEQEKDSWMKVSIPESEGPSLSRSLRDMIGSAFASHGKKGYLVHADKKGVTLFVPNEISKIARGVIDSVKSKFQEVRIMSPSYDDSSNHGQSQTPDEKLLAKLEDYESKNKTLQNRLALAGEREKELSKKASRAEDLEKALKKLTRVNKRLTKSSLETMTSDVQEDSEIAVPEISYGDHLKTDLNRVEDAYNNVKIQSMERRIAEDFYRLSEKIDEKPSSKEEPAEALVRVTEIEEDRGDYNVIVSVDPYSKGTNAKKILSALHRLRQDLELDRARVRYDSDGPFAKLTVMSKMTYEEIDSKVNYYFNGIEGVKCGRLYTPFLGEIPEKEDLEK